MHQLNGARLGTTLKIYYYKDDIRECHRVFVVFMVKYLFTFTRDMVGTGDGAMP